MKSQPENLILRRLQVLKEFLGIGVGTSHTTTKPAQLTSNTNVKAKVFDKPELKTLLWIDDRIDPLEKKMDWLSFSPIGKNVNVIWLKSFADFKAWIEVNGLPHAVCFDDDLCSGKNGVDCVQWLVKYCFAKRSFPPQWSSHSTNPMSKAKIKRLLKDYTTLADQNKFEHLAGKNLLTKKMSY